MVNANSEASWTAQTLELVKMAKAAGVSSDDMRKLIATFVNIDTAIKIAHQTETLLIAYRDGTLDPTDFLDSILAILRTDKPLMGAKSEALHNALGIPMIQKAPRQKKPKPEVVAPSQPPEPEPAPKKGRRDKS